MWRLKGLLPKESGGLDGRLIDVGSMKVQVQKMIAQGGFSVVYKCTAGGRIFALKHLIIRDKETFDLVQKEINIMLQLRGHPNVVVLHAHSFQDTPATGGKECFLLLDYCGTMLVHAMDGLATKGQFFNEQQVLTIFRDVCNAVYAMHTQSPPIAHRDLKAENVLTTGEGSWKLCDFGSCSTNHKRFETEREMGEEEDTIRKHTTPAYRAPEMWDLYRRELISEKVDIWALGCLLYRVAFFRSAFDGESKLQILNGNYRIPESPKYSPGLINLIRDMLAAEPGRRPDVGQVWRTVNELLPQAARKPGPDRAPSTAKSAGPSTRSPEQAPKPARTAPPPPVRPTPSVPSGSAASGGAFWSKFGDSVTSSSGPDAPATGPTLGGSPPDSPRKASPAIEETLSQLRPPSPQLEAQPKESSSGLKSSFLKTTGAAADMLRHVKGKLESKIASATGHEKSGFADSSEIGFMKAGPDGRLDSELEPASEPVPEPRLTRRPSHERPPSPRLPSPQPRSHSPQPPPFVAFDSKDTQGFGDTAGMGPVQAQVGVASRSRTFGENGRGAPGELERVKEELRKVLDEKAYLAERCSKMEFIIRALQEQIKELQTASPVVGLVKDEDRQPGGRRSFAAPVASNTPAAGSFWDRGESPSSARAASLSPPPSVIERPPSRPGSTGVSPSNSFVNLPASSSWQSFDSEDRTSKTFAGSAPGSAKASPEKGTLFDPPSNVFDPPTAPLAGLNGKGQLSPPRQQPRSRNLDPFEALSQLRV